MTKRTKEKVDLSTAPAAVRSYRAAAKMLANLERQRRFHASPFGRQRGPRARRFVTLELYPMEYATFLGLVGVGMVLNGDKTKGELLALLSGKKLPDATRPKKAKRK